MNPMSDLHENINNLLVSHPELVAEVADFVGVTIETVEGWLEGKPSMGGLVGVLQAEYLRRHNGSYTDGPVASIRQAMINGLADQTISIEEVVRATGANKQHLTVFVRGGCGDPGGERLLRTRHFLTGKNLLSASWQEQYKPETLLLVDAFVNGKSLEEIADTIGSISSRVKEWVFGYCNPPPNLLPEIRRKFGKKDRKSEIKPATDTAIEPESSLEVVGQALILAAEQVKLLGEEFLRRSGPKDRQALREQNPGVFMRAGNALTNLTSEESYNRNFKKPKEGT